MDLARKLLLVTARIAILVNIPMSRVSICVKIALVVFIIHRLVQLNVRRVRQHKSKQRRVLAVLLEQLDQLNPAVQLV